MALAIALGALVVIAIATSDVGWFPAIFAVVAAALLVFVVRRWVRRRFGRPAD